MIIDSHQHFWDRSQPFEYSWLDSPELAPINRNFLPSDLEPLLNSCGIDKSVIVQTQHKIEENHWALKLAEDNSIIAGVVGWVDLASPDCEEQLLQFKDDPKFVGIRHVTQDEPNDDFIIQPSVMNGLKVLEKHRFPFDLLFYTKHLKHAATLGKELPDLPMVINHLSKPNIKEHQIDEWEKDLEEAAKFPNMHCKLSGMITEANWESWTVDDLRPFVEIAIEAFGPSRCMYGSDWPVCLLAGEYERMYSAITEILSELSDSEKAEIFGGTAIRFYNLPV